MSMMLGWRTTTRCPCEDSATYLPKETRKWSTWLAWDFHNFLVSQQRIKITSSDCSSDSAHSSQCLLFRSYKTICSPITCHLGMKTTKAWDQQTPYRPERRAKVSFPFQHWSQNIIQGQAIQPRLGSIIACVLCCVYNYTLMMYFHATVPRKWLGSNGPGMGERVRLGNIWGKGE